MEGLPVQSTTAALNVRPIQQGHAVESPDAMRSTGVKAADEDEVREQVKQFVGGTFFQMMLKSMRRTVPKDGMFSGGRGEEVFRDVMDEELVKRMAGASSFKLVDAAVRQLATPASDTARGLRAYRQQMPRRWDDPAMARMPLPTVGTSREDER